jgi:DNA-binding transcriptional MerR regulator
MTYRRFTKFTPERIRQIKDLVARGVACEEIAALVEVTVGTLKVTCSRLGISLRKPEIANWAVAFEGGTPCAAVRQHRDLQHLRAIQRQRTNLRITADASHGQSACAGGIFARSEN